MQVYTYPRVSLFGEVGHSLYVCHASTFEQRRMAKLLRMVITAFNRVVVSEWRRQLFFSMQGFRRIDVIFIYLFLYLGNTPSRTCVELRFTHLSIHISIYRHTTYYNTGQYECCTPRTRSDQPANNTERIQPDRHALPSVREYNAYTRPAVLFIRLGPSSSSRPP